MTQKKKEELREEMRRDPLIQSLGLNYIERERYISQLIQIVESKEIKLENPSLRRRWDENY